ncbi:unnamed protein product [Cercospora beticola]|nr:unnamed protein product [Cercospora beticola]
MDLIEPGFRPLYEKVCVGNKGADAQHIFFEGMLIQSGLGMAQFFSPSRERFAKKFAYFRS